MGYQTIFESEDEYCYVKRIGTSSNKESVFKNEDMKIANTKTVTWKIQSIIK